MPWLLTAFILLETAHTFSPIALSWFHAGFRNLMLANPLKYIMPPCIVFGAGMVGSLLMWPTAMKIYLIWNFWHFSMQNFGIFQMIKSSRPVNLPLAFGLTTLGIWVAPLAISAHHWLTDIGLSCWVMRGNMAGLFAVLALLGTLGFSWSAAPWLHPEFNDMMVVSRVGVLNEILLGFRLSLGLYHFDVSRRLWKLGDPQVRATIGRALLAA